MILFDETNQVAGTYYEVLKGINVKNLSVQYELIAGAANTVELQFWATVFEDASGATDDDWVNITEFLTSETTLSVTNSSVSNITLIDTDCMFVKVRVTYIVTASAPSNTIKIGYNSAK